MDNYIKKLSHYWKKFINNLPRFSNKKSFFNSKPVDSEPVTVFATDKDDYRDCGTARHNPFMPSNKYGNTSCFRILNLLVPDIWMLKEHVLSEKIKMIYGRFDLLSQCIYNQRLSFDPDNKPERHANIINWPSDKQAKKSCAQQIAAESTFHCEVQYQSYVAQVAYDNKKKLLMGEVIVEGKMVTFTSDSVNKLPKKLQQVIDNLTRVEPT